MKIRIQAGYTPGIIGKIAELHATYYHQHWGLDLFFEAKVATELSDFLMNFDASRDGFWYGTAGNQIAGSIAIVGSRNEEREGRLRWLIVAPAFQHRGLGESLIAHAVRFCGQLSYRRIYLTTFAGLDQARHLYEKTGFRLCREQPDNHWGKTVVEQEFEFVIEDHPSITVR